MSSAAIADIYELSPMQKAMLFHALHTPGTTTSFNQFSCRIVGNLDSAIFRESWHRILNRQPVLRTSFHWEELDKPVQIVHSEVRLPWSEDDWRTASPQEQRSHWREHLKQDLATGFALNEAPLMRCRLARIADREYLFNWSHHHLLTDGWCLSLVMEEVFHVYGHLTRDVPLKLAPVYPYRDYIKWLQQRDAEASRQFWTRYLEGFHSPTPLPSADRRQRFGSAVQQIQSELPEDLSADLRNFAAQHRITMSTIAQGAWAIILARYASETDVVFGTTVSGRPTDLPGIEKMLGLFINTIPVRMRVDPKQAIVPWLKMIQARQIARTQFEHTPLPDIQRWSEIPPATSLFESNLIFMNYPLDESLTHGAHGLAIEEISLYNCSDTPIELEVTARNRWSIELGYDPQRFDPGTMRRMLGHLVTVLEQFIAESSRPIGRLSMLAGEKRRQILEDFNNTAVPFDASDTFVHRFERAAAQFPDSVCVEFEGARLSARQLNSRANRLAHRFLEKADLNRDDIVAIIAHRSHQMMEAILAIWKCGAAYLPIDPDDPTDRIRRILDDSGAKLVLRPTDLLIADESLHDPGNLGRPIFADSLAYVIYTSGSTGRPKGAMVEHAGMLNHLLAMIDEFAIGPTSVIAQTASHCFDISVWQFFTAPLAGGTTVILGNDVVDDPARFLEQIRARGINILELIPSHITVLLEHSSSSHLRDLSWLLATGEAVSPTLLARWFSLFPHIPVVNAYGPTEASDDIALYRMTAVPVTPSAPIGKPIRNTRIYITDDQMNLCPIGVNGEICVAGIGVGRGYLNDEVRTRLAFLEDPFQPDRGVRMYRTGDIGCFLEDGTILLAGRKDQQVKLRGHRIELGEIENALAQVPQIREGAAVAHRDSAGHVSLCAYLVFRAGQMIAPKAISAALAATLPDYMVPSQYVTMEQLPLNRNGKINRAALPAPSLARSAPERAYTPPRSAVETLLCDIWGEALGIKAPGIHDNFFALGGDSILSMRIVSLAARACLKITTRQIFQHSTVAELATVASVTSTKPAEFIVSSGTLPLTPIQKRFFLQCKKDQNIYNQALLLQVPASIDPDLLRCALKHAATVHDALRLRFHPEGSTWVQEVVPDSEIPLGVHEISPDHLARHVELAHARLDISAGPVFRAEFFRLGGAPFGRLLLIAHHLTVDGVSWGALLEILYSTYTRLRAGASPETHLTGASWAEWASTVAARPHLPESILPASSTIPVDYDPPNGADTVSFSNEISVDLSESATAALLTSATGAYNTQINDLLLAAFALTISHWSGNSRVLFDLEGHGRDEQSQDLDITRTVGWFTTITPMLLETGGEHPNLDHLIKCIKEQLRSKAAPVPTSQPQLVFNYLGQTGHLFPDSWEWQLATESSGSGCSPNQRREHLVAVNSYVIEDRLRVVWDFSCNFHRKETIRKLASNYLTNIERIIAHCAGNRMLGFTPSDFPAARLSQPSLDSLATSIKDDIADIYELTPTQQGMLFHGLYAPESDAYFNSLSCRIDGDLDVERFHCAWRGLIARHPILRTSFHWDRLEKPAQVVRRTAPLPWFDEDISALPADAADARWRNHLEQDRTRKFDLAEPPLMRVTLCRIGPAAWRFNWSHHHILLDGWSSALIMSDLVAAYDALQNGRAPEISAPPPFRDYVTWLQQQNSNAAEEFWKAKLRNFTTPTPLPLSVPEMEGTAAAGSYDEQELVLAADATEKLNAFAQSNSLTMNTVAQGAWAILLGRYSSECDVVFGTIFSGRPAVIPDSDRMVGLFINSLPVRVQIAEIQLASWLQQLQSDLAQQDEYAYCPLAEIQKFADLPPGTPLFETLLIFQNYPIQEALEKDAAGLHISQSQAFDPNNYPLTLVVTPGKRLSVKALFDNGRFDAATIARLLGHFETLVSSFAASPCASITKLPILTEPELNQILKWNDTPVPIPSNKTLVDLIDDGARSHPDRIAVRCAGTARTYKDVIRRSNSIARYLMEVAPLQTEDRIAVVMSRSERMIEIILAIWKCGAAYVPIDPAYPAHRIETILSGAKPQIIIAEDAERIGGDVSAPIVHPDSLPDIDPAKPFQPLCRPSNLAYVIFTSGSTGKPKGAMVEHRGMLNHVLAMARRLDLDSKSVIAQTASHCSDISVWQFFAALISGGETVIYPDSIVLQPAILIDSLRRDSITAMQFVPTYLSLFLAELDKYAAPALSALKTLLTIGETLQPASVRAWFRLNPGTRLINTYGPTEASDSIAHYCMSKPPDLPSIPIGKPIRNLRLYVVDSHMNLCPVGVKGEICVAGIGVGRGYLFDEERTRAVFQEDPFGSESGTRLYHTGDIGCFTPEGNLLFFGRRDFQVKIRGYRIELGEIESVLTGFDGITNAVVVARDEPQGRKYLCGYAAGQGWTPASLRDALREKLPAHMIPDVMILLDELPVTPNGKINRAALPAPTTQDTVAADPEPPVNELEAALTRVFSEVLGRERVGVDDNFFQLGGHSLKAIQIISRIRSELSLQASVADIFTSPTPRALARKLDRAAPVGISQIAPLSSRPWYEVSHAQKRLWLASRGAEPATYNMAGALLLEGPLDTERLRRALEIVVDRHESLRTVFAMKEGELKQAVLSREQLDFRLDEASIRNGFDDPLGVGRLIQDEAHHPFDLGKGPLFRAKLIHVAPERNLLLLTLHHVIADAWSVRVLTEDLRAFYAGRDLAPLPIQYRDYAHWHNLLLQSPEAQVHRRYWLEKLPPPIPRLRLPYDFARSAGPTYSGQSIAVDIEDPLHAALNALARAYNTSLYAVVLTSICALLRAYSAGDDIVIGTVSAGRDREELEPLIGAFLNPFALRVRIQGSNTIAEVIKLISKTSSEALDHSSWPFDRVLEDLKIRNVPNRSPVFDVQVDYIPAHEQKHQQSSSELQVRDVSQNSATSKFDLSFHITEDPGRLHVALIYNSGLFRPETVAGLRDRLLEILEAFAHDPHASLECFAATPTAPKVRVGLRLKSAREFA